MSIYKELSYDQNIDVVRGIQFGVLGPDEIRRRSVVEVKKTDTYSGIDPIVDGLFDPRMGVLEHSRVCATCEQKNNFCPGHFGHIELARPVFHAMFFDHIKRLMKCVCYRCSRVLVSEQSAFPDIREAVKKAMAVKNLEKRNSILFKLCSNNNKLKKCGDGNPGGCNARQPNKYYKENALKIMAEWKETGMPPERKEFMPEEILRIFQRISEQDMELLGFNPKWSRPEWMVCTVLPVPPPSVRPSIIEENGQRREDDLTHKLCDIIKTNNQLKQRIDKGNATEEQLRLTTMVLQYHVATFVDNQLPGIPPAQQRNGRRLKSLCDRLKKKEGRIRGNLNGKRVDQSARSVITPDPYISLDELGVPIEVAMKLTFPETVNAYNLENLRRLVKVGPDVWPGAKYVRKAQNGNTFSLRLSQEKRDEIAGLLQEGDIVDRHLADGDYILFNRQPSLHKMSMMCHRAKVMPYNTFRLPVLTTSPYNADFDGDEMNAHNPQSIQTMCELMDFAAVPYHIITPKDAAPIVEIVQDTMLGAYRITKDHVRMTDKVFANLQMVNSYFKGELPAPAEGLYTGRQAYSQVLPPALNLAVKNKQGNLLRIENSQIVDGVVDKNVFSAFSKGILPVLFHDYGPFEVRRFMDNTQRLICRWLITAGFSVGISDLVIPPVIHQEINANIQEEKAKAYKKIEDVRKGAIVNNTMLNNHDFMESEIINILNGMNNTVSKRVTETLDDNVNRLVNMVKSGSKGKPQNVAQMIANVGQQNVDGKRVAYGFTDRTLPHYTKFDDGPEARGFVENSFISGLTPQEVFFHAMGGREGLIDTAVKSVSGDTRVRVMVNKVIQCVNIGDWIDAYMTNYATDIEIEAHRPDLEFLSLVGKEEVYIPTGDGVGNVSWGLLTAVTRHDPTDTVYEIETAFGRKVVVADSESLLVWNSESAAYEKKHSRLVNLGDKVPIAFNLKNPDGEMDTQTDALRQKLRDVDMWDEETVVFANREKMEEMLSVCQQLGTFAKIDEVAGSLTLYQPGDAQIQMDTVLDVIVKITPLNGKERCAKMYDVTVPSTCNFNTLSGLVLYDTSETGYLQRRLVKAMEDCKIYNDQTVRNASGNIVQFIYGEDGMEGTKIERQAYPVLEMSSLEMEETYHLRPEDAVERYLNDDGVATLKTEKAWVPRCKEHYEQLLRDREDIIVGVFHKSNDVQIHYPIPFVRIIENAYLRVKSIGAHVFPTDLTPQYILDTIDRLIKELFVIQDQGVMFLHVLLRLHLSPKVMLFKYRFSKAVFDWIVGEITRAFHEAVAPAGEMVGIIAAQSMGEPATQLTLDSFHVSGTAAAVKATSGVPRLKELLSVSKNIKTPSLKIYLKRDIGTVVDPVQSDESDASPDALCFADPRVTALKERALHIRNQLEITRLSAVLDATEIFWDPPGADNSTAIEADQGLLGLYREFEEISKSYATSPWLLRMKINKDKLHASGLTMLNIYMKLYEAYPNTMECVFSDDNADELVMRIRMIAEKETKKKGGAAATEGDGEGDEDGEGSGGLPRDDDDAVAALKAMEHNMVHNLILKGIPSIKKVSMRSQESKEYSTATTKFHTLKEWILETDGSNLIEILCNPNVDATRVISNDVWEIFHAFGVEAARTALYNEIMDVIRESSVNYRHLSLLIDTMTHKGSLMSIDRHGINRGDVGPLAKSSFEETTDMLNNAGVFSDYDKINGVSANIMLGQLPPCGTGDSEILLDEEGYMAILREYVDKKKKSKDLPAPVVEEVPPVLTIVPQCDLNELAFDHKMPKKSRQKTVQFELPADAPF